MDFLIADTFTDSLSRLSAEAQKAAKTTAFDLQVNPSNPGLSFHKIERAKDKNFWSVRVSSDIRIIVHKTQSHMVLCYVNHHDKAYEWAERRRLEKHPTTGAAQLIEIRELVKEIVSPVFISASQPTTVRPPIFAGKSDEELLGYGVPSEWLDDVRKADEDTLLGLAERLPQEAAEALLELAIGGKPRILADAVPVSNPFEHPDAQRRFRVMANVEELQRALDSPWDKWLVFLHPEQRRFVEREYPGPVRISGSAGTGKTVVALHRAVHLARKNPDARILLATFSDTLAFMLRSKLRRLIGNEPRLAERIDIDSFDSLGARLFKAQIGPVKLICRNDLQKIMHNASESVGNAKFTLSYLMSEWDHVVDAWQLDTWEAYRDVARLGRKTRLSDAQRKLLWSIFEIVLSALKERDLLTYSSIFDSLVMHYAQSKRNPYDYAVIDEAQDISVSQLRFFSALFGDKPDGLFFSGDPGQRIFRQPFSWKSIGVDVTGRSYTLRINYRTSHQIRKQADLLLDNKMLDVDGNTINRKDTISIFNGPQPVISSFTSVEEENEAVATWLLEQIKNGIAPHEIGVFVRSDTQIERAKAAAGSVNLQFTILDDAGEITSGFISICTMHLAKGLEFRAVAVMACDDEVVPLQERIEEVGDDTDLKEVYDTERHLLYVACTRARDTLLVTSVEPASEFLGDLRYKL